MQPYHVYIGPLPTLLDNLLEDSELLFHKCCAFVQRVFHEQWITTLGEKIAEERIEHPNTPPDQASVLAKLQPCRGALREKQRELIREIEQARALRDAAIRAYVEALPAHQETYAAA